MGDPQQSSHGGHHEATEGPPSISKEEEEFLRRGFVRFPAFVASEDVHAVRTLLQQTEMERHGRDFDDPGTWYVSNKTGMQFDDTELERCPALLRVQAHLRGLLRDVFGAGVWRDRGQVRGMCRVPVADRAKKPWTVNHATWHTDEGTVAQQRLPTVLVVWLFLDSVQSRGGGTLMLAGSSRVLRRMADDEKATYNSAMTHGRARNALAQQDPWVKELFTKPKGDLKGRNTRLLNEGSATLELQVVENVGEAGDVVLFDPRLFHAERSRNVCERPRMLLRIDFACVHLPGEVDVDCVTALRRSRRCLRRRAWTTPVAAARSILGIARRHLALVRHNQPTTRARSSPMLRGWGWALSLSFAVSWECVP
eukprot:COSAG06_NODE_6714_length_2813_cov_1.614223_3_plen_367_part_00